MFAELQGLKIVGVGSTLHWSREWKFFSDFLLTFLRSKLGPVGDAHPVARWYAQLRQGAAEDIPGFGRVVSSPLGGYVSSIFYLAYALYLIAHHDQVPASMIQRLRRREDFRPAVYEAFVGAAFALAGYSITADEARRSHRTQGEFTATSKGSGKAYSIEAKCKTGWRTRFGGQVTPEFAAELRQYVSSRIYKAAVKRLPNPVYWLELSIPGVQTAAQFDAIRVEVIQAIRGAEARITVKGQPPEPAYVFVTNHAHLVDDDLSATSLFAMLDGFRIPDFLTTGPVELEAALESHDRHRDMTWLIKSLREVQRIPTSFDGTPDELRNPRTLEPVVAPKVGERISVERPNGEVVTGVLVEVTATNELAWIVVNDDATGEQILGTIPLKPEEARAAAIYGDNIFGKPDSGSRLEHGDYLGLYDWLLDAHKDTSRENMLAHLRAHPDFRSFEAMATQDVRVRLCREWTKSLAAQERRAA